MGLGDRRAVMGWVLAAAVSAAVGAVVAGCGGKTTTPHEPVDAANPPLSTGRFIAPAAVAAQNVGSLPVNLITSADGRYAISTDGGYRQSLWAVRVSDGMGVSRVGFASKKGKFVTANEKSNGLYYGLAAGDGVVYAAQGARDAIAVLSLGADGSLTRERVIETRRSDFPTGLALDGRGRLYVANNDPVGLPPARRPSSVAVYDAKGGKELGRFEFTNDGDARANFVLAIAVTRDGKKCYVGSQRDSAVYVLDTSDPAHIKQAAKLETGSHPIALKLNRDESKLFVANAHSDTISFVDTATNRIATTILLRPDIARSLAGATPTGLALSPNEKFLYATLGDMNAVAVIDVPDKELEGYIPAGWYPTGVVTSADGKRLLVANAKGTRARYPNPSNGDPRRQENPNNLVEGDVISVEVPDKATLKAQTQKVMELARLTPQYLNDTNPLEGISRKAGRIKHVIYIVKENRTYDHVLGDLPQGNGDPRLTLFGREVTPNQHALAERFVLMDNFYDSGEVSGDGWTWSTQAMANEYTIRNVPYQYSGRGRVFDYEGTNNDWPTGGFPAKGPDGKPLSDIPALRNGVKAIPDVAEAPGGHLWDLAKKHDVTYRNWGMFTADGTRTKDGKQVTPDNWPASSGLLPAGRDLAGITDYDFRKFDLDYPDSEAWKIYYDRTKNEKFKWPKTAYGKYRSVSRFTEWNREFREMLKKDPTGDAVPNLMLVCMGSDHTHGGNPGKKAPKAMVADNDYAMGQVVEAVSHSPIWKNTAIFMIEDDAQNGPDHVDAHRSTCYVISPYVKKGSVDHTFHNTSGCLRSIELLLNLPPMCQYDAIASPVGVWDDAPSNDAPYEAILPPAKVMVMTNPKVGEVKPISPELKAIEESEKMDFTHADRAPADKLNEVLWLMIKGGDVKMPPTPGGIAGVTVPKTDDDDD